MQDTWYSSLDNVTSSTDPALRAYASDLHDDARRSRTAMSYGNRARLVTASVRFIPNTRVGVRSGSARAARSSRGLSRFAEAIEAARVDVVPRILIGGGGGAPGTAGGGGQGSLLEALLALMLSDRLGDGVAPERDRDPRAGELRDALRSAVLQPGRPRTNGDSNA